MSERVLVHCSATERSAREGDQRTSHEISAAYLIAPELDGVHILKGEISD